MTTREAVRVLKFEVRRRCERHDLSRTTDAMLALLRAISRPTRLEREAAPLIDFLADYNGWVPVEKRRACEKWLKSYMKKEKR